MDLALTGTRAAVAASSSGLGYAIAHSLSSEGARVAICSRDAERVHTAADRIRADTGGEVLAAVCDAGEPGEISAWIGEIAGVWGGLDAVVPNAGGPPPGLFRDLEPDQWDAAYRLTLRSAMETAHAARPHLTSDGSVLFLTGISAREPVGTLFLSTVFRTAVAALAKVLADEWAPAGIRVNHLIPGRIATDRVASLDSDLARRRGTTVAEVEESFAGTIPLGRYGDPDEFAAAATFLLSPAASYITGATLQCDGGVIRSIT